VFTTIGAAVGPPFAGFMFDITKSYSLAFIAFVVTYAVGAALSFLAIPPKRLPQDG